MKNKKVWRMIKKILRTICIWGIIAIMVIPTFAIDEIETIPLHKYYAMRWVNETHQTPSGIAFDSLPSPELGYAQNHYRAILQYQSALNKDTFYHMQLKLQATNTISINWLKDITTGQITQQGGEVTALLLSANDLASVTTLLDQSAKTGTPVTLDYSYETMMVKSMTSYVGAKAYYYFTKNSDREFTVDMIFYFNDQFFNYGWSWNASATRYMQCYLGIMIPLQGYVKLTATDVYPVGGSDYNGKLDEIIALLQSQGGGLTREDIQLATEQALEAHDRKEEARGEQATTSAEQQAEQAMARYTAVMEQMKTAMAGIEDIKNIDTSTYTLTIGPFTNPMTGGVFPAVGVDFYTAYQGMPAILKSTCPIVVTFFVLMAYAREFLDIFKHVEKTMHGEDEQ